MPVPGTKKCLSPAKKQMQNEGEEFENEENSGEDAIYDGGEN